MFCDDDDDEELFPPGRLPGLRSPMNDDEARGDVEVVVVISWVRTRAAAFFVWRVFYFRKREEGIERRRCMRKN